MDIETLASVVYDDLPLHIDSVRVSDGGMVLEVTCKDWEQQDDRPAYTRRRRRFDLLCDSPADRHVCVGNSACYIKLTEKHPVLLPHSGPQGNLLFASAPEQPGEVFYRAHAILDAEFEGWMEPSRFLNGNPVDLRRHLESGAGLLASGPLAVLTKLKANLEPLLKLSVVQTHEAVAPRRVLVLERNWVICDAVDVQERVELGDLKEPQ